MLSCKQEAKSAKWIKQLQISCFNLNSQLTKVCTTTTSPWHVMQKHCQTKCRRCDRSIGYCWNHCINEKTAILTTKCLIERISKVICCGGYMAIFLAMCLNCVTLKLHPYGRAFCLLVVTDRLTSHIVARSTCAWIKKRCPLCAIFATKGYFL